MNVLSDPREELSEFLVESVEPFDSLSEQMVWYQVCSEEELLFRSEPGRAPPTRHDAQHVAQDRVVLLGPGVRVQVNEQHCVVVAQLRPEQCHTHCCVLYVHLHHVLIGRHRPSNRWRDFHKLSN